ncbi:winged helix-turn-helix transcriptional regulator [Candidatus Bathyarchaeota archaeon]|nr:winged helix-turn-helix transcriptional regulator [Candidatus Bathyarchaeota archaeon]
MPTLKQSEQSRKTAMEDLTRYYTLLKDPARRKIIEILGTQEKIGFKELRETLGLGVGTVYYHLDMLSDFISQDKQRKYKLNDRGKTLYRLLSEGNIPATAEIGEAFSHRIAKWLFLSPLFARTSKPLKLLPVAMAVLLVGAFGTAYAELEPALFFYSTLYSYTFATTVALFLLCWLGFFLFAEIFTSLLYRRVGNDLQLFTCLGLAAFPVAVFPYIYLFRADIVSQIILFALQIWCLLLVSAALCFGKGIRLDKAVVVSLTGIYLNTVIMFILGRFA